LDPAHLIAVFFIPLLALFLYDVVFGGEGDP